MHAFYIAAQASSAGAAFGLHTAGVLGCFPWVQAAVGCSACFYLHALPVQADCLVPCARARAQGNWCRIVPLKRQNRETTTPTKQGLACCTFLSVSSEIVFFAPLGIWSKRNGTPNGGIRNSPWGGPFSIKRLSCASVMRVCSKIVFASVFANTDYQVVRKFAGQPLPQKPLVFRSLFSGLFASFCEEDFAAPAHH